MQEDTTSRFLTVPLISDGPNTGFKAVPNPDYTDPCPQPPSYTLKEIEALGLQYTKEAYADDDDLTRELELSRFLAWLAKREREGMIDVKGIPLQRLRALPPMPRYSGLNELAGGVKFYIGVNLSVDEMREWSPQRITQFFEGVAKVIVARGKPQ